MKNYTEQRNKDLKEEFSKLFSEGYKMQVCLDRLAQKYYISPSRIYRIIKYN